MYKESALRFRRALLFYAGCMSTGFILHLETRCVKVQHFTG